MDRNTLAVYAQQIIDNPAWGIVVQYLDNDLIMKWKATSPDLKETREIIYMMQVALASIDTQLRFMAQDTDAIKERQDNTNMGIM